MVGKLKIKRLLEVNPDVIIYDPRHKFDDLQGQAIIIRSAKAIRQLIAHPIRDPVAKKEALQSLKEDKVKPLRFVIPLKGYRAYYKFPILAVKEIEGWFKPEDFPVCTQVKYDGVRMLLMKDGDKIIIRTDDGEDVTKKLPSIVALAKKILPKTVTLDAEVEYWIGDEHQPREEMAGLIHEEHPDDSGVCFNIFDVLYFDDPKYSHHDVNPTIGDLHNKPYELRLKYLDLIDFKQSTAGVRKFGFNLAPTKVAKNPKELLEALKWAASGKASEGSVVKSLKSIYELDGLTDKWLKWKKMGEIHAIVYKQEETKTKGVYTLYLAVRIPPGWKVPEREIVEVNGKKYMHLCKSFNVKGGAPVGSIVTISFHTINHYKKLKTGEQWIRAYEPKFIERRPKQKVPDSARDAIDIAHQLELLTVKELAATILPMDDKPHKAVMQHHYRCEFEDYLPFEAGLPGSPWFELALDNLIRSFEFELVVALEKDRGRLVELGRSVHTDFRIKVGNVLKGFTIMDARPGKIKEPVRTVKQAKELEKDWETYFKLSNKPETYLVSPRRKLWVELKKPEPLAWLNVEGVVPPGKVGATRYEFGVFSIFDRPIVYPGAQKPDFCELFLYGKRFTGRWVVRLLPNPWRAEMPRRAFVWLMWKPEEQTPYVLSRRAVQKRWMPPDGISCLPPEIRQQIPEKYQYWKKKGATARAIRDELVKAIRRGEVKIRPVKVIRRSAQ